MPDIGISRSYQFALIDTMNELIGEPRLADEVRRRAIWLKWALEGREPGNEPLEFIADAGFSQARSPMPPANPSARAPYVDSPSLAPEARPCSLVKCSSVTASIE